MPSPRQRTAPAALVRIRIAGPPAAVEQVSDWINHGLAVHETSLNYPNRRDPGVRRYLTVLVEGTEEMNR